MAKFNRRIPVDDYADFRRPVDEDVETDDLTPPMIGFDLVLVILIGLLVGMGLALV